MPSRSTIAGGTFSAWSPDAGPFAVKFNAEQSLTGVPVTVDR